MISSFAEFTDNFHEEKNKQSLNINRIEFNVLSNHVKHKTRERKTKQIFFRYNLGFGFGLLFIIIKVGLYANSFNNERYSQTNDNYTRFVFGIKILIIYYPPYPVL